MAMDDDKLIKLVEAHDVIYDRHHHAYKNLNKKMEAFVEIAAELGIQDVKTVIHRYRTLRDRFTRYKRIKKTKGEVQYYLPVLDKMDFLTPHVFSKKRINKSRNMLKDFVIDHKNDDSNLSDPLEVSLSSMLDESETTMEMLLALPKKSVKPTCRKTLKRNAESHIDENVDKPNHHDSFCEAITHFKKLCKSREERQENAALQGFGQMIIATISKMNPHKQTKAMLLVTEAVMKIKMEED